MSVSVNDIHHGKKDRIRTWPMHGTFALSWLTPEYEHPVSSPTYFAKLPIGQDGKVILDITLEREKKNNFFLGVLFISLKKCLLN